MITSSIPIYLGMLDTSSTLSDRGLSAMFASFIVVWTIIGLAIFVLSLIINWRIASKAGYSGALSLLMLIPLVNLIIVLIFAFGEWPVEAEVKRLRGASALPHASPSALPS